MQPVSSRFVISVSLSCAEVLSRRHGNFLDLGRRLLEKKKADRIARGPSPRRSQISCGMDQTRGHQSQNLRVGLEPQAEPLNRYLPSAACASCYRLHHYRSLVTIRCSTMIENMVGAARFWKLSAVGTCSQVYSPRLGTVVGQDVVTPPRGIYNPRCKGKHALVHNMSRIRRNDLGSL